MANLNDATPEVVENTPEEMSEILRVRREKYANLVESGKIHTKKLFLSEHPTLKKF